jgi:hypothetical protein
VRWTNHSNTAGGSTTKKEHHGKHGRNDMITLSTNTIKDPILISIQEHSFTNYSYVSYCLFSLELKLPYLRTLQKPCLSSLLRSGFSLLISE